MGAAAQDSGGPGYRRLLLTLACATLLPIVPFALIGELPGERFLDAQGQSAWRFGLAGAGLLGADLLLPIPSSIIGAMLGARLGFWSGLAFTWLGLMGGHLLGYGLGRLLPDRWASRAPEAPTLALLFLTRPVPVFAEAVTLAAGVHRVPPLGFVASCALGNGVYAAAMAGDGAALLPEGLAGPGLLLPMAVPVLGWLAFRALSQRPPHR